MITIPSLIGAPRNTLARTVVLRVMEFSAELEGEQMPSQMTNFDGLLASATDAFVGVDEAGVIRFVNRQTELLFGYDRDDLVGQPIEILVPESRRAAHRVERQGFVQHPRDRAMGVRMKLRGRRRDGTKFPVDISLNPIDTGDGVFVLAAVRDMTGSRRVGDLQLLRPGSSLQGSDPHAG